MRGVGREMRGSGEEGGGGVGRQMREKRVRIVREMGWRTGFEKCMAGLNIYSPSLIYSC